MTKNKKTTTKSKGGARPLLLTTSIIGILAILLSVVAGILKCLKDEYGKEFPVSNSLIGDLHYGVSVLVIAGFICAMIFIALRARYNSTNPKLNTKVMVSLNSVFWAAALILVLLLGIRLLADDFDFDFDIDKTALSISVWFSTALVLIPVSVVNAIAFKQAK